MVDMIVSRRELKPRLAQILRIMTKQSAPAA
jgi:acetyl-CoA carboxylase beta subunit